MVKFSNLSVYVVKGFNIELKQSEDIFVPIFLSECKTLSIRQQPVDNQGRGRFF